MLIKKYIIGTLFLFLFVFNNAFAIMQPAQQTVAVSFPENKKAWQLLETHDDIMGFTSTYTPRNENDNNWTKLFQMWVFAYSYDPNMTIRKYQNLLLSSAKKSCSQVDIKTLQKESKSLTFQVNLASCRAYSFSQIIYVKIFAGVDAIYAVSLQINKKNNSAAEINKMRNVIINAKLVNNPAH